MLNAPSPVTVADLAAKAAGSVLSVAESYQPDADKAVQVRATLSYRTIQLFGWPSWATRVWLYSLFLSLLTARV